MPPIATRMSFSQSTSFDKSCRSRKSSKTLTKPGGNCPTSLSVYSFKQPRAKKIGVSTRAEQLNVKDAEIPSSAGPIDHDLSKSEQDKQDPQPLPTGDLGSNANYQSYNRKNGRTDRSR